MTATPHQQTGTVELPNDPQLDATAPVAWVITVDRINDDEDSRTGNVYPGHPDDRLAQLVAKPGPHRVRFTLADDDGETYYAGFLSYDPTRIDDEAAAMAPLAWAERDAGAVSITFKDRPDLDCS